MKATEVGVIPYLHKKKRLYLLLVTTQRGRKWIFPKGHPEKDMRKREVAALEALEEVGAIGAVHRHSHVIRKRDGKKVRQLLYAMPIERLLEKWPECKKRKRMLVPAAIALKMVSDKGLRESIQQLQADMA